MIGVRKSLSKKLSLGILLLAMLIFTASLGVLFTQSRYMIRVEAVGRANSVLNSTMQQLNRHLMTIETATNVNSWMVEQSLQPDSLLNFTNRIVRLNPHIDGCSISTEPDVFPQYGRYFSAYSVRETDTITTVIEEQYDYFSKIWYKTPHNLQAPCWVAYYDEGDSLELTIDGMIASYGKPLYDANKRLVGIISTDLSLRRLSKIMSQEKPYPNSYFMMIDQDGRYFIHPDSTKLFTQTIYDGTDPRNNPDIIALGHEMTAGNQGRMNVIINGKPCLVCYQPVPSTKWSMAIVCPDSDVLAGYHRLTYIIAPLLIVGLIVILLLCYHTVAQTTHPLLELLEKSQSVAEGNMEVYIPHTKRIDVVGRLQNSFATMLQSLNIHMGMVRYSSSQTKMRNEELVKATQLVEEADRQKTAFIQNVSHQIRTPLNIIMGFAQVLSNGLENALPEEEMKSITAMMDHNSKLLNRMLQMLFDSSDTGFTEELNAHKQDLVSCNDVVHEAISYITLLYPELNIHTKSDVADDFCIHTSQVYLLRSLSELLYNSAKYSDGKNVSLNVSLSSTNTIRFIVENTGNTIAETDRDLIFKFFTKVNDLSEGLGLGLPLAKRHAQNLGGDLTLDVNYHDGCRFIIELPVV
jgi:signal transduction histidine kinase